RRTLGNTRADRRSGGAPARARPPRADSAAAGALRGRTRPVSAPRGAEGRLRTVRALRYYGPRDLRVEEVPRPEAGPGEVLVQVEAALTDGTDRKAYLRGHPLLLGATPSPFGHELCGVDVATGRRVVAANSA